MKTTPYFYLSFLILTVEVAQAHGKVGLVAVNIQPPATARSSASENNSLKNDETQQTAEPTGNEANAMAQQSTSVRELAAAGPTASLDPRQVVKKISAITSETRNRILDEIKTRIEASERALANLRDQLDKQGQGNLEFN
ncbi:MAG: hypothetical protein KGJ37_07155, partial [Verrucomicrobiota bacterium]|nr:hypothetical protein [Verrucomicrobiota bacterium]